MRGVNFRPAVDAVDRWREYHYDSPSTEMDIYVSLPGEPAQTAPSVARVASDSNYARAGGGG